MSLPLMSKRYADALLASGDPRVYMGVALLMFDARDWSGLDFLWDRLPASARDAVIGRASYTYEDGVSPFKMIDDAAEVDVGAFKWLLRHRRVDTARQWWHRRLSNMAPLGILQLFHDAMVKDGNGWTDDDAEFLAGHNNVKRLRWLSTTLGRSVFSDKLADIAFELNGWEVVNACLAAPGAMTDRAKRSKYGLAAQVALNPNLNRLYRAVEIKGIRDDAVKYGNFLARQTVASLEGAGDAVMCWLLTRCDAVYELQDLIDVEHYAVARRLLEAMDAVGTTVADNLMDDSDDDNAHEMPDVPDGSLELRRYNTATAPEQLSKAARRAVRWLANHRCVQQCLE